MPSGNSAYLIDNLRVNGQPLGGAPPPALCTDSLKNGTETDVDCGGGACTKCTTGYRCEAGGDCTSGACVGGVCEASAGVGP